MITENATTKRDLRLKRISCDLVVAGGGLAGICCAVTAARAGLKVTLVQDRPVLGGNASSEVRLWVLGATSHMGNNNRWAREGGVIDELLLENAYRNPEGNPLIFDTILLEKIVEQENVMLLLNTAMYDLEKSSPDTISSIRAFCSQNATSYTISAPLFCDASGDGIVGFMAGAAFRMGAESKEAFGEKFAPSKEYGELLGHSMYFYTKDTGKPVKFIPPSFALSDITKVPRFKSFNANEFGCRLWWIEYGGRLDTIHETETIKWELWKVVYGVWNHIKNCGQFPEAENLTLEWVGTIPGKRESRRFEGDYMLKQQDIIEQKTFEDTVAFGGWSIDLHPADGVFSEKPGCNQWHSKGVYGIPYRCLYSRNISNLFLAGRIISATHVAFGSSRVMATCAHGGQAVAMAATICRKYNVLPKQAGDYIKEIQTELLKTGQHLPGLFLKDVKDLVQQAIKITASSTLSLSQIPGSDLWEPLQWSVAQMVPVSPQKMSSVAFYAIATVETTLSVQLRKSSKPFNHTPDIILETFEIIITPETETYHLDFSASFEEACYAFVCFIKNENIHLSFSDKRITGLLSVFNSINPEVSNYGKQDPKEDIGVETFEFWCPKRRPGGRNIALQFEPALKAFDAEFLRNGIQRPTSATNAWVADFNEEISTVTIQWKEAVSMNTIELFFDTDFDHPLETVLMHNPETVMPFCPSKIEIFNGYKELITTVINNYLTRRIIILENQITVNELKIVVSNTDKNVPNSLFEIRCY